MDPTLAEIRLFAGNFAPLSWAYCNGALLSIAENTALFSLLGTTFGGDGQVTFALPDLRGRVAVGTFQGNGLSNWDLGQVQGVEQVTLLQTQIPAHIHGVMAAAKAGANTAAGNSATPGNNYAANSGSDLYAETSDVTLGSNNFSFALQPAGGTQPHNNMMPYLALNFIIAVEGIYPSRN